MKEILIYIVIYKILALKENSINNLKMFNQLKKVITNIFFKSKITIKIFKSQNKASCKYF